MIYLPIGSTLKKVSKRNNKTNEFKCYIIQNHKNFCGLYYENGKLKEEFCLDNLPKNKLQKRKEIIIKLYKQFKSKFKKGYVNIFTNDRLLINTYNLFKSDESNNFINLKNNLKIDDLTYTNLIENFNNKLVIHYLKPEDENLKNAIRVSNEINSLLNGDEIVIMK